MLASDLRKEIWQWRGHSIQYTVSGEGAPVLLIHGFGASLGHWRKNIPVLAEAGLRVYALDLLGFGGSDKPLLPYELELWRDQIKDFCQEYIQEKTIFVGNSIGGLLALMLLDEYPEISAGGILLNCAGGLNHRPEELNLPLRLMMGGFTNLISLPLIGKFLFNQIRQKNRIRQTLFQVYCNREAVTDELVEILHEPSSAPNAQKVFATILSAPPGPRPQELLEKLEVPLLVLWGDRDPWTPIRGAKIYQDNLAIDFATIKGAGHCPHDENPTEVNQKIILWLEEKFNLFTSNSAKNR